MERLRNHSTIFYSTHILDDVQRVSDRVAILNRGELVAQGPIETLLAGNGDLVFTLRLAGNTDGAYERIKDQPWVADVVASRRNGYLAWRVAVTDEAQARHQLLRLVLAEEDVDVLQFGQEQAELEQVFMDLVQEQA
jgi:ABC-2 type transport system ATP-binding protein